VVPKQQRCSSVEHHARAWSFEGSRGDSQAVGNLFRTALTLPESPGCFAGHGRDCTVEAVRLAYCRRCRSQFAVCQSCDRGQEHCTRRCAAETRREDLRQIRRRYRRSPAGRAAHRDQERRRRQRQRARTSARDSVGDQPSQIGAEAAEVTLAVPALTASSESESSLARAKPTTALFCCHSCGRSTHFVAHRRWQPRWRPRRRGSS
jgi:hypothetical protein